MRVPNRNFIYGLGLLGIALVVCTLIARNAVLKARAYGSVITVTGAAVRPIRSDFAVWDGNLMASSTTLEAAYATLNQNGKALQQFLKSQGFADSAYQLGPVQIDRAMNREGMLTGYRLYQRVTLELADVDRVSQLAREASALIAKGVELTSQPPRYLFTGLENLKIEMIKAATENAKVRAQQLAETTGRKVGAPVSARVGVFQIRPRNSQEVSDYGINDVSSLDKEIVSTVSVAFQIE